MTRPHLLTLLHLVEALEIEGATVAELLAADKPGTDRTREAIAALDLAALQLEITKAVRL